ncbi:uncharacterized protein [Dysidea avara]|uniref:uncharacterized protein n=1 Tax=Dysidea avara TaxID=196820 RepID=UPI00333272E2
MAENFYSGNRHRPLPRPLLPPARPLGAWNTPGSSLQDQTGGLDIDQEDLLRAYHELQRQNNGLLLMTAKMSKEVQLLREETQCVREVVMSSKESQMNKANNSGHKRLPKDLSMKVRLLHSDQDRMHQFRGQEKLASDHNRRVAATLSVQLTEEIRSKSEGLKKMKFSENEIKCAIRRYHEAKRRQYLDSLPVRQEHVAKNKDKAKRKQFRSRLYHRRFKAVQTEEERSAWLELSECYMTEESDDEAEGVVRRHQLPWASDTLQELKATLDQRLMDADAICSRFRSKPRVDSSPSTLPPPPRPIQWAVVQNYENRTRHVDHDSDDLDPDSLLDDHDPDSFDEHSSFSGMITTDAMHLTGDLMTPPDDTGYLSTPTRDTGGRSTEDIPVRNISGIRRRLVDMIKDQEYNKY